jgi:hypothetical protein
MSTLEEIYTETEIISMFSKSNVNFDTKNEILAFVSGFIQCMYNMTKDLPCSRKLVDYPDLWHVGYNKAVEIFQKHNG